jgi:histidyl-tRNA synthetase
VDYTGRKLPAQIKTAERQGIAFIICIGEEEQKTGEMKIKNLAERKEYSARREELDATLKRIVL